MAKITRTAVADDRFDTDEQGYEPDEQPTAAPKARKVQSGWGQADQPEEERRETIKAPYIDFGKQSGDKIVKILNEQPIARWSRHFVPGKPPIYCHGGNCGLCAKGYKATQCFRINVVEMSDPASATPDGFVVKVWDFTWPVAKALIGYSEKMDLNDPRRYFQLVYSRGNGITVVPLNLMALEEEHGLQPMAEGEFDDAFSRCYDDNTVFINTPKQVEAIAESLPVYVEKNPRN